MPPETDAAESTPTLTLVPQAGELSAPRTLAADRPVVIGRAKDSGLRLLHESVSKHHARIEYASRTWHLTDLGSLNGTFRNGERIASNESIALRQGDDVSFGTTVCRVQIGRPGTDRETAGGDPYRTRATIFLRLQADDQQTRELGWEEFRRKYAPVIVGFARNAGLPAQDADDVLQTVMLNFFRVASTFDYDPSRGRFRGYLKRATLNVIRKRVRKKSPLAGIESEGLIEDADRSEELWEQAWAEQMMSRAVEEARDRFDARTFEAFDLYARRGVPATAVAERLGMAVNSVHQAKSRVMNAITEIMDRLRDEEG